MITLLSLCLVLTWLPEREGADWPRLELLILTRLLVSMEPRKIRSYINFGGIFFIRHDPMRPPLLNKTKVAWKVTTF